MKTGWRKSRWMRILGVTGLVAALLLFAAYLFISYDIGLGVRSVSAETMQAHEGDRVEALMAYVQDPSQTWRNRNRAVWALGQLGDARALPLLKSCYTGGPCDHDRALCQHELDKAIQLLDGGVNLSALVWRRDSL